MSQDFKIFLAASVLNDGNIISYRYLGRELKVHSNTAKKMLSVFYTTQRDRDPRSINATYILSGVPRDPNQSCGNGHQLDGEDTHTQSSPYMSSSMPDQDGQEEAAPSRAVFLVNEEDLEGAKATLKQIHSLHIYSLGPSRVQNLQILSDCNRAISMKYANEDPLVFQGQLGVIHNAGVERRTCKRPSIGISQISTETTDVKARSKTKVNTKEQKNAFKPFGVSSSNDQLSESASKAVVAPKTRADESRDVEERPASKRSAGKTESSDTFRSFSRPMKSLKHANAGIWTSASLAPNTAPLELEEDEVMIEASEDEQEDVLMASNAVKPRLSKSQSKRAEQLRKMMDDEDDQMEDREDEAPQISQGPGPLDNSAFREETSPDPPVVVTEGRRRGRRKVLKKKTTKDEEGYLVTIEEPAWESFSEDEPLPPQNKKTLAPIATSSLAKGKKTGGKPGQGNIMSFFGKK